MVAIQFEAKRPIMDNPDRSIFRVDPHLDVVMRCDGSGCFHEFAFECKFTEPYRESEPERKGLKWPYLREKRIWEGLPACQRLGRELSPRDDSFKRLHAGQLLKHILGLKHANGRGGFCLVYLWYEAPGIEASEHRKEITEFTKTVVADGIAFQAMTFQEVIGAMSENNVGQDSYVDYLVNRYL